MSTTTVTSILPSFQSRSPNQLPPPTVHVDRGRLMAEYPPSKPSQPSTDTLTDTSTRSPTAGPAVPPTTFAKPSYPAKKSPPRRPSSDGSAARPGKRPRPNPPHITAEAAQQDKRRARSSSIPSAETTPNPAKQALSALMGVDNGSQSAVQDRPSAPATKISAPLDAVAQQIQESTPDVQSDVPAQTSPASLSSITTVGSNVALSGMETATVASPRSIGEPIHDIPTSPEKGLSVTSSADEGSKAFSYPGPIPGPMRLPHLQPNRGMSLPGSDSQNPDRSPSNKKHRCSYCATEFTRHHNLKSHLLTHSREKPYVCQTCQSRFRRLHDLKRHAKLHTGERPHICPKCGRKFARGDALARHNKGLGGCAGRRGSTGSFGPDDDDDDENVQDGANDDPVEGLVYGEPEHMDEDEGPTNSSSTPGRARVPSIQRQAPAPNSRPEATDQATFQSRQPSTYPPIQGRPSAGIASGLFPPPAGSGSGSPGATPTTNTSQGGGGRGRGGTHPSAPLGAASNPHPAGSGNPDFPTGSITESPKPLSPGAPHSGHPEGPRYRNRSPSTSSPFSSHHLPHQSSHQQPQSQAQPPQYARGSASRRTPPPVSMGAPMSGSSQLPPPHPAGLNPPDARYTLPSQGPAHPPTGPTGPPTHMTGGGLSSHSNSLSSHGQSAKGSGENSSAVFGPREDRLWAYVKSLEDRINGLQGQVASLKDQLAAAANPPNPR